MKKPCLNKTMKNEDIMNKISLLRQPSENGSFNPRFIVSSSFPLTPVAPLTFVCAKETKTRPLPVPLCEGGCQAEAGRATWASSQWVQVSRGSRAKRRWSKILANRLGKLLRWNVIESYWTLGADPNHLWLRVCACVCVFVREGRDTFCTTSI